MKASSYVFLGIIGLAMLVRVEWRHSIPCPVWLRWPVEFGQTFRKTNLALLVRAFGEISDQEAAMKEIFDAFKPGGILSVTEIIFNPCTS